MKLADILSSVVCPQAVHSITEPGRGGRIYTERFVLFIVECVIFCVSLLFAECSFSVSKEITFTVSTFQPLQVANILPQHLSIRSEHI